jgi:hypothetical protein
LAVGTALASAAAARVVIVIIIGPNTPNAHSSPGMIMRFSPRVGDAGETFTGTARGFKPGEYVTAWEFQGRKGTQLLGGQATRKGTLKVYRTTAVGITAGGRRKLCLQGERTKRVACGNYRVRASGGGTGPGYVPPTTDPGYTPPTTGPGYVPPAS